MSNPSVTNLQAQGASLRLMGHQALWRNDLPASRAFYLDAIDAYRHAGDARQEGYCLLDLAKVEQLDGDQESAYEAAFFALACGSVAQDRLLMHISESLLAALRPSVEGAAA